MESDFHKIRVYPKGKKIKVSENFESYEFDCRCSWEDCNKTFLSEDCIDALQSTRNDLGDPIIVACGTRCARRNKLVGGVDNSSHLIGDGVDLIPKDGDLERLAKSARKFFKFVMVNEAVGIVHADMRFHKSL